MRNADCWGAQWQYDVQWRAWRVPETISESKQKALCQHSDRDSEMETDAWAKTCGSQRRGVGPQIRGSLPFLPAFSIKPQHTGSNLWTWPSDLRSSRSQPGAQPLAPPQLHQTTPPSPPMTLWPGASTVSPCKTIHVICMFLNASTCTHPRPQTEPPAFSLRGSVVILQHRLKGDS